MTDPLVIETDIGRDPDDVFALIYWLSTGRSIDAICVSPGDHDQVALVKTMLRHFSRTSIKVLTPKARVVKRSITPYHEWLITHCLGGSTVFSEEPDGHEDMLPASAEIFICGPVKMSHLIPHPTRITMQGGFVPYTLVRPVVVPVLAKFEGRVSCPTFNLGGSSKTAVKTLIDADCPHLWVGKNVCHAIVYDSTIHAAYCPALVKAQNPYERLHVTAIQTYLKTHSAKAWHDPLAAVLAQNPELAVCISAKPEKIHGAYTAVLEPKNHSSLYDLTNIPDVWDNYFASLKGHHDV